MSDDAAIQKSGSKRKPLTIRDDGVIELKSPEAGALLFGSKDEDFIHGIAANILAIANEDTEDLDERTSAYVASIVEGIEPRDQLEGMLATQMAATHFAIMRASRWMLYGNEDIKAVDSAERTLNKLCRTFTTQIETLKKYRADPVRVRDVNVSDGGQAIVGNVNSGNAGNEKN